VRCGLRASDRAQIETSLGATLKRHAGDAPRALSEAVPRDLAGRLALLENPLVSSVFQRIAAEANGRIKPREAIGDEVKLKGLDFVESPRTVDFEGDRLAGATTASDRYGPTIEQAPAPAPQATTDSSAPPVGKVVESASGQIIDKYRLEKIHGKGGLGRIWLARDDRLNRDVALKELHPHQAERPHARRRFLKEAQVTGQLEHPNIVPVYELGDRTGDKQPFYTMRFIKGETMSDGIRRYHERRKASEADRLELSRLLRCFLDVCDAIAYAHSRGVVHRDLKPENIILGAFGEVLVLDWGLAKMLGETEEIPEGVTLSASLVQPDNETMAGTIMGTPGYMAPEQARGELNLIDTRTDIYGLGAILFEIVTGAQPHRGESTIDMIMQIASGDTPRARAIEPSAPRALDAICARAMAKAREDRYPEVRALAADIERWLADERVSVYQETLGQRLARLVRRHGRWVRWVALALVLVTAGSLVATFVVEGARRDESLAKKSAEEARLAAEKSMQEAYEQRQLADQKRDLAERSLYLAQIHLAQESWERAEIERLEQLLANQRPRAGARDLRGWEWYYLDGLTRKDLATFTGHTQSVNAATFVTGGSHVASAGDETIHVWEAATGREVGRLAGHERSVTALAWNEDAGLLASSGADKTVRLWKLNPPKPVAEGTKPEVWTQKPTKTFKGHEGGVSGVAWSADGDRLASASHDGTAIIWNLETGEAAQTLDHSSGVYDVAWNPDGKELITASLDHNIRLWSVETGRIVRLLPGHVAEVVSVAYSPSGNRLASASFDGTVRLWDMAEGATSRWVALRGHFGPVRAVSWHPDGRHLASVGRDRTIRVWDTSAREDAVQFRGHTGALSSIAWSPDGNRLVSASEDHQVKVWDSRSTQGVRTLRGHADEVMALSWNVAGRLASAGKERTIYLWKPGSDAPPETIEGHQGDVTSLDWDASGQRLASVDALGRLRIHTFDGAVSTTDLKGHSVRIDAVSWRPDGKLLATASSDQTVQLWDPAPTGDARTQEPLATLSGHTAEVAAVSWHPKGTRLASGSWDGLIRVWDMGDPAAKRPAKPQTLVTLDSRAKKSGGVLDVSFSPDGRFLAAALGDQTVAVWAAADWHEAPVILRGHSDVVNSLVWSRDSSRLATGSSDGSIRIWDVATGQEALSLRGHVGKVLAAAWSRDGSRLATAGQDTAVKVWDAAAKE
jgi:WD40 repeat protein/serine/threonine protein kinase